MLGLRGTSRCLTHASIPMLARLSYPITIFYIIEEYIFFFIDSVSLEPTTHVKTIQF